MSRLGVQLGVDDFESYRAKMLDAQRIAVDTQRVINGLQNPTFGNYNRLPEAVKRATDQTDRIVKQSADRQISEAERVAKAVERINQQTIANRRSQSVLLGETWGSLGSVGSREGRIAPQIARAREEQEKLNRATEAYERIQGRIRAGGPLSGEQRYARINLARQGADVFTQAGSGASPGLIAIQQGPQIVEAMAFSGLKFSGAMAASAAAIGGIALAGLAVVKWTESARTEAERLLKVEERITAEWNKQALKIKSVADERDRFNERRGFAAGERELDRQQFTSGDQIRIAQEQLQREIDLLRKYSADPSVIAAKEARILQYDADLENRRRTGMNATDDSWFKKQAEEAQRFAEDVKKGQERVKELGETWRSTFRDITRQTYADNPFVQVFFDADEQLRKLKKNLEGLPADMRAAAIASQQAFNSKQLFGARIDNAMGVFDLREMAARFRDDTDQRRAFAQAGLDRQIAGDNQRIAMGGVNVDAIREYQGFRQRFIDRQFQTESPGDKLDRQLAALDKLDPKNSGEQALLDQRILRTASGIDPANINAGTRERLAQIAERAADREEKRFQEVLTVQKEMAASLKLLSGEEKKLNDEVAKGGSNVINLRIQNEAEGTKAEARPSQTDTQQAFANVMYGGSNQGRF